ncbi:homoserine kinase [Stetteria hydrogenophila]
MRAMAYSSSANLGPGFDALAVALDAFHDSVEAWLEHDARGVVVEAVEGEYAEGVPVEGNNAKAAVERLLQLTGSTGAGVVLRVRKGVPPGRGLGSSGATAAAAVVAAASLLEASPPLAVLLDAAGEGERAASGSPHYDNVAASLLGHLAVVAFIDGKPVASSLRIPGASFVVGVPMVEVPEGKTGVMRSILSPRVELPRAVANWQRLALLVASLARGDYRLAGRLMMGDGIVEPARAPHVPCYGGVKRAALEAGAYGVTISGAGPSMIALTEPSLAGEVARAVRQAYEECGVEALVKTASPAGPATAEPAG